MSRYMTQYHAKQLLEALASKGFTTDNTIRDFMIKQQQQNNLPLSLKIIAGIGACIASLCFIGFLSVAGIVQFQNETGMIIWSILFIAAAMGLQYISGQQQTIKEIFLLQCSFVSMAVGKIVFVMGLGHILSSSWSVAFALLIVTGITYPLYRIAIDRFLSSFAVLFAVLLTLMFDRHSNLPQTLFFNGFFFMQFVIAAFLLTRAKLSHHYIPLCYAMLFSLGACCLSFFTFNFPHYLQPAESIPPTFSNIMLAGGLIALFGWIAGGMKKLNTAPLIFASCSTILLSLFSAPGILFSIGLMVLGYAKHERLLMILGILLMPIFLCLYYYNLNTSLLQKSGILVGSGIILLVGRWYLQHKGWDKPCVHK
jgi:hypothetical protein